MVIENRYKKYDQNSNNLIKMPNSDLSKIGKDTKLSGYYYLLLFTWPFIDHTGIFCRRYSYTGLEIFSKRNSENIFFWSQISYLKALWPCKGLDGEKI